MSKLNCFMPKDLEPVNANRGHIETYDLLDRAANLPEGSVAKISLLGAKKVGK